MKVGNFNMSDYLNNLNESAIINTEKIESKDGIIIPDENKKSYDWLKQEYKSAQQSVKIDIKMGGTKFKPSCDMQAPDNTSAEKFTPGIYGNSIPSSKPNSGKDTDFKPTVYGGKKTSESDNKEDTSNDSDNTEDVKKDENVDLASEQKESESKESESKDDNLDKKITNVKINN
ncbi:MAG: hypothetical protein ACRDD8_11005 [Bacteroidales bacterium]